MHLDSLNLAERQLLSRVKQIAGLMEEKHEQLQRSGLFGEYGKIYEVYAELIGSESQGLEALKRATFLYWYHTTEPPCFSGLYELSENVSRKVLGTLERKIEAGELDSELKWMLPYYNMIAEWAFLPYTDFSASAILLGTSRCWFVGGSGSKGRRFYRSRADGKLLAKHRRVKYNALRQRRKLTSGSS